MSGALVRLDSVIMAIIGVVLVILVAVISSAVYYGWQVQRLKRHQKIVPHRLQKRYHRETQAALIVIIGTGLGLAIVSLLR